jgi:hypothetical protein
VVIGQYDGHRAIGVQVVQVWLDPLLVGIV